MRSLLIQNYTQNLKEPYSDEIDNMERFKSQNVEEYIQRIYPSYSRHELF
jgi:hypothetical protein